MLSSCSMSILEQVTCVCVFFYFFSPPDSIKVSISWFMIYYSLTLCATILLSFVPFFFLASLRKYLSICRLLAHAFYCFFVSVFLQLSEFLSLCKFLCLFLSFFFRHLSIFKWIRLHARACQFCISQAWLRSAGVSFTTWWWVLDVWVITVLLVGVQNIFLKRNMILSSDLINKYCENIINIKTNIFLFWMVCFFL